MTERRFVLEGEDTAEDTVDAVDAAPGGPKKDFWMSL